MHPCLSLWLPTQLPTHKHVYMLYINVMCKHESNWSPVAWRFQRTSFSGCVDTLRMPAKGIKKRVNYIFTTSVIFS